MPRDQAIHSTQISRDRRANAGAKDRAVGGQIARTIGSRGYCSYLGTAAHLAVPFFRQIEIEIVLLRKYRPANGKTKIVEVQRGSGRREEIPGIHSAVADKLVDGAVVLVRTGF